MKKTFIIYIILAIVFLVVGWLVVGKVFAGNEKKERDLRWASRLAIIGDVALYLIVGAVLNKNEIAVIGCMLITAIMEHIIRTK